MIAMRRMSPTLGRTGQETLSGSSGIRQDAMTSNCAVSQTMPCEIASAAQPAPRCGLLELFGRVDVDAEPLSDQRERHVLQSQNDADGNAVARIAREERAPRPAGCGGEQLGAVR